MSVELKLLNIVGTSVELNKDAYMQDPAWTKVGLFDQLDGTDSDTRMGRVTYAGGARILYYTAEGGGATIKHNGSGVLDISAIQIVSGRKYVVKFFIPDWSVSDPTIEGVTATVYLGATNIGTNALSATNRSGLIEGVVTASGGTDEVYINGFADVYGYFSISFLSIKEYDENKIYDTIDLYDDLAFPITYQIDDISNPDKRKTNFSKTITIPGTKNNNIIFNNIFDIDSDSSFNPNKKLDVVIYQNTNEIFRGVLKLDNIILTDKSFVDYEITLLSSITNIFTLIGDSELTDLNFSEYNHTLNAIEQVNSWGPDFSATPIKRFGSPYQNFYTTGVNAGKPKGEGYLYCLINNGKLTMLDYGNYMAPVARVADIFPGIYLREYLTKIFKSVNKTWTSNLFDSIPFRKLVIPFNDTKIELTSAQINTRKFNVLSTPKYQVLNFGYVNSGLSIVDTVAYNDETSTGAFDNTGSFNTSGDGVWYCIKGGTYNFTVNINLSWKYTGLFNIDGSAPDGSNPVRVNFEGNHKVKIAKISSGIQTFLGEVIIDMPNDTNSIVSANGTSTPISGALNVSNIEVIEGDQIYIVLDAVHNLQTTYNNDENGVSVTPRGLFYQPTPAMESVLAIRDNSPLTNNTGDKYLVKNPSALDAWYGNEGFIATKNSGAGWSYSNPPIYTQIAIGNLTVNGFIGYYIRTGMSGYQYQYSDNMYYSYLPTFWRPSLGFIWENYSEDIRNNYGGIAELVMNVNSGNFYNDIVNNGITDGSYLDMNFVIPKNIKQKDLLTSVLKMYNCFMTEDKDDPNNIIIEPRDDFYSDDIIDTWKFDLEKPIEIAPLSEMDAKQFNFTYTADNDYINDNFLKNWSQKTGLDGLPFGAFVAKYDNDFLDGKNEIKSIFSPCPVWRAYPNKAALPSVIDADSNPIKSNIRLLYYNGRETREPGWTHIFMYGGSLQIATRYIPSLNMWDDMYNPQNSLMWANTGSSYYYTSVEPDKTYSLTMTQNTLYNKYYAKYMRDITNKNSKLVTAYIKLNVVDINKLDFGKLYFINGHWLRLYRVSDYNPFSEETTRCEFLKYQDGRAFTGVYNNGIEINGGTGYDEADWILEGQLGLARVPSDLTRVELISEGNGGYNSGEVVYQSSRGVNNYIAPTAERIYIIGDNNTIFDFAKRINIVNSDNVTIGANVTDVSVSGTNNINITESNVSYINGIKFKNAEIIESNSGGYSIIDGGLNELNNPFGCNNINVIDGGLDTLRELGSDSEFTEIEGGI